MRVQVPTRRSALVRFFLHPVGKLLLLAVILANVALAGVFTFYYVRYAKLIDAKLRTGPFANTSMVFAAPRLVMPGDQVSLQDLVDQLRRSSYGESRNNRMGWYHLRPDAVEIFPGPESYFRDDSAVIRLADGKVSSIISLRDQSELPLYLLEPELITNLFDRNREKRRIVQFDEIPSVLVHAIISAEDKRFFQHAGFDPLRIVKAGMRDIREGRKAEGASTLSMQLARGFFLDQEKTWSRKFTELLITLHLEQKLTKEEIFAYYANQVNLGRRGSFSINGFGEGSQAYFGKDIKALTLPEASLLAGLVQRPSHFNPVKWPDRARARRNIILWMMRENGYISDREYNEASNAPIRVAGANIESTDAPYFVDMVNDSLQREFEDYDFQSNGYRVYTTLDLNLQHEAAEAVRIGMNEVDEQLRKMRRKPDPNRAGPQVALVALDAQTGELKAFIGGRNYSNSQLDRALAHRQPGSAFKPFVFAAALNTAITGGEVTYTPSSTIEDEPTTFWYDNRPYQPNNHHNHYYGTVTIKQAIAKSMNIPTVKLAEAVGYRTVVDLARKAGMNMDIRPTPSVALGAYEVTPLEVAGSYTVFANRGMYLKPSWIRMIRDNRGAKIFESNVEKRAVLDARVNYLMVNMMEEVLRSGTGAGVRTRGFQLPAAGKTGTSHDGWFVGFTSKLICAVWVGYDDNRELPLEGARSALPVWTEFMKRAHRHREYRGVTKFAAPEGVVSVNIDPESGMLATDMCPVQRADVYITGTQPAEVCPLHGGGTQVAGWDVATQMPVATDPEAARQPLPRTRPAPSLARVPSTPEPVTQSGAPSSDKPRERRGFFGKIRDIFK